MATSLEDVISRVEIECQRERLSYEALMQKGLSLLKRRNPSLGKNCPKLMEAIERFKKATQLTKDPEKSFLVNFRLGSAYRLCGNRKLCEEYLDIAMKLIKSNDKAGKLGKIYLEKARLHMDLGDLERTGQYLGLAKEEFARKKLKVDEAISNNLFGRLYLLKTDNFLAYQHFVEADHIFRRTKDMRSEEFSNLIWIIKIAPLRVDILLRLARLWLREKDLRLQNALM